MHYFDPGGMLINLEYSFFAEVWVCSYFFLILFVRSGSQPTNDLFLEKCCNDKNWNDSKKSCRTDGFPRKRIFPRIKRYSNRSMIKICRRVSKEEGKKQSFDLLNQLKDVKKPFSSEVTNFNLSLNHSTTHL